MRNMIGLGLSKIHWLVASMASLRWWEELGNRWQDYSVYKWEDFE